VTNPIGLKQYFSKGVEPAFGKANGLDVASQGRVTGRRSGFSQNLGTLIRRDPAVKAAMKAAQAAMQEAIVAGHTPLSGAGTKAARQAGRATHRAMGGGGGAIP
jgi:hypothetical protein